MKERRKKDEEAKKTFSMAIDCKADMMVTNTLAGI